MPRRPLRRKKRRLLLMLLLVPRRLIPLSLLLLLLLKRPAIAIRICFHDFGDRGCGANREEKGT